MSAARRALQGACRACVAVAAVLVPSHLRRDWRAEWDAEIADRWERLDRHSLAAPLGLLRRSAGAFIHAAWLRKEHHRMESLLQDVRFALRLMRRDRVFTAVAVLTLALGIGANTALFSVLNGTLLKGLPYPDPARLVLAWETVPAADVDRNTPAPATAADWQARSRTIASFAPMTTAVRNVSGDGDPERLLVLRASAALAPTLGIAPAAGRAFTPDDDRVGAARVVLLSDALWARRYRRDPSIVGRTIRLDAQPVTVIGILPRDVPLPVNADAWIPLALAPDEVGSESRMLWVVARLAPAATVAAAQAELSALVQARTQATPAQIGAHVERLDQMLSGDVRPDLLLVFAGTAIVLIIASANVAMMLLARASSRTRELALRAAVGASRGRIVRQLLCESLVLAVSGAAAGALIGSWILRLMAVLLPEALRQRIVPLLDWRVLSFLAAASIVTLVVSGITPALTSWRRTAGPALGAGARATDRAAVQALRSVLVMSEVALTVLLVSAAVLLGRTFWTLLRADLGFRPDAVLTMQVQRGGGAETSPDAQIGFYEALEERLSALPGVRSVGLSNGLPVRFTGGGSGFLPEGAPKDGFISGNHRIVNGAYFDALQIPLLQGRTFTSADRQGSVPVAVVSRAFADRAWKDGNPIGRRFTWGAPSDTNPWITVIGVVGDIRLSRALAPTPHVYLSFRQVPEYVTGDVALRVDGDPMSLASAAPAAVHAIDPNQAVAHVAPYTRLLADSVGRRRFTLTLMLAFAALALLLSSIGLYGVLAFIVGRRTREIGVRLALGASVGAVRRRVLRDGLTLAVIGSVAGVGVAVLIARFAHSLVPGLAEPDPIALGTAVALLLAVAALACDIPARRASRIDPISALRTE